MVFVPLSRELENSSINLKSERACMGDGPKSWNHKMVELWDEGTAERLKITEFIGQNAVTFTKHS